MPKRTSFATGIGEQGVVALVVALLGWAAVASMMFTQDHGIITAGMVLPAGVSIGLAGAFLAAPIVARSHRPGLGDVSEPGHIHIARPAREYFSPYTCCPKDDTRLEGDPSASP